LREQVDQELASGRYRSGDELIEQAVRYFFDERQRGQQRLEEESVNPVQEAGALLAGESVAQFESAADIAAKIDAVIADDDMYEPGEPRPSLEAATKAKDLIVAAERGVRKLPKPKVSVYFGEIDVTWTVQNRLLRLIVFPDSERPAVLYFQTDQGEALTRGESVEVSGDEDLSQRLDWLLG